MKADRLLAAFEQIYSELKECTTESQLPKHIKDEITDILCELLEELYTIGKVADLEAALIKMKAIDIEGLQEAINIIRDAKPQSYSINEGKNLVHIDPIKLIQELEDYLLTIQDTSNSLEISYTLQLEYDPKFYEIALSLQKNNKFIQTIYAQVLNKLEDLDKGSMLLIWSEIKRQFNAESSERVINYSDIIPREFWDDNSSIEDIRKKYAEFIVKIFPLIIERMCSGGTLFVPIVGYGVFSILALNNKQIIKVSRLQIALVRGISQVIAIFEAITHNHKIVIANAIGTQNDSLIFDGEYYEEYKKYINNPDKVELVQILLYKLQRLKEYANQLYIGEDIESKALWQYKLGQEVIAPTRKKYIIKENEIGLQKEICKFLLERGIYAYGKSFGRNFIDLYIQTSKSEDFIIEVKKYVRHVPTSRSLNEDIIQLKSYMDIHLQPRGILVIYNCTDNLIISPRNWIDGRIWILVINIGDAFASKRKRSLEIKINDRMTNPITIEEIDANQRDSKKQTKRTHKKPTKKPAQKKNVKKTFNSKSLKKN